jgi:hypothetical protein
VCGVGNGHDIRRVQRVLPASRRSKEQAAGDDGAVLRELGNCRHSLVRKESLAAVRRLDLKEILKSQ